MSCCSDDDLSSKDQHTYGTIIIEPAAAALASTRQ